MIRNQTRYILIAERYRNINKSVKVFPEANANSNHNPLIVQVNIRLKKAEKPCSPPIDINKLQKPNIRNELQKRINENISKIESQTNESHTHEYINKKLKDMKVDKILQLMDKRGPLKRKKDE